MTYRNFNVNTIVRISLLVVTIFLFFLLVFETSYRITTGIMALIIIAQVVNLINYIHKTNRYLSGFLEAVRYSEFSRGFNVDGLGSSFDELKDSFSRVIEDFREVRKEKEEQHFFLQNVIQHIGISMIAYYEDGKVEMYNNACKRLFQLNDLKEIDDLNYISSELPQKLYALKNGEKTLIKIHEDNDILQLSIHAKEFKINDRLITLVSIQNIQHELEEKEVDSWQKLIRVLTHEIMNSITPIGSLSSTVQLMVEDIREEQQNTDPELEETLEDIQQGLQTIGKRSKGLQHFVETFRNLTKVPPPKYNIFFIREMLDDITNLFKNEIENAGISLKVSIKPENLELTADRELIEQIVINLVKNAIHGVEKTENPTIELKAFISGRGEKMIQVTDNGQGILPEVLDKIFIPFFTTKQKGSGIGLAISKQIMRLHGGTITAWSEPEKQTIFTLKF